MKFICLGHFDPQKWAHLSEKERNAKLDECLAYDDQLREQGHFAGGEALEDPATAVTLRYRKNRISATDGPFAETKELLGGILILEAKDLNQAVELMSKHPGVKVGPFEIRPAADLTQMIADSEARRGVRNALVTGS